MNTHIQRQTRPFAERILGVVTLDREIYSEIAKSSDALPQAAIIVAVAALANAVAETGEAGLGPIGGVITVLVAWIVVSAATWLTGTLFTNKADDITFDGLLKLIGFAFAPLWLMALSPIPVLGIIATLIVGVLCLLVMVTAVSVGIHLSTGKAVMTLIAAAILAGLASLFILSALGMSPTTV